MALAQGAVAVVIAGGVGLRASPIICPRSGFRDRFIAKGRFERRMDDMPVKLITYPEPGLFGAAAAFAKRAPMTIDEIMRAAPVIPVLVLEEEMDWAGAGRDASSTPGCRCSKSRFERRLRWKPSGEMARVPGSDRRRGHGAQRAQLDAGARCRQQVHRLAGPHRTARHGGPRHRDPFLPGVATAADIMRGLDLGLDRFKFFPAEASGRNPGAEGALPARFGNVRFCPTGGIRPETALRLARARSGALRRRNLVREAGRRTRHVRRACPSRRGSCAGLALHRRLTITATRLTLDAPPRMLGSTTLSDRRGVWAFVPWRRPGHRRRPHARADVPDGPAQSFRARRYDRSAGTWSRAWPRSSAAAAIAAYGLLPRDIARQLAASADIVVTPPGRCAAQPRSLAADVGARDRADHRHHETRDARLHAAGHDDRISRHQGDGFVLPLLGAERDGDRLDHLGLARRHLRPQGDDPAVGGDVRRHLDLRSDAVARGGTSACAS